LSQNIPRAVVQVAGEVKGPARRIASVESDYIFVSENLLTKELNSAHATRLRFYKDKELNFIAELVQATEPNDHQLCVVSKILGARYNEQSIFHELIVAWRGFQSARPPGNRTLLWLWMFQRW
jgi:hypothetical protein